MKKKDYIGIILILIVLIGLFAIYVFAGNYYYAHAYNETCFTKIFDDYCKSKNMNYTGMRGHDYAQFSCVDNDRKYVFSLWYETTKEERTSCKLK